MSTRPFPAPGETVINIVGIVSLVSSLLYRFPQIYRTYKTRSAADISIYMLVIQNISYVGYIVYGVLVWDSKRSQTFSHGKNLSIFSQLDIYAIKPSKLASKYNYYSDAPILHVRK